MNGNKKDSTEFGCCSAYHRPPRSGRLCTSLFRFHALKRGFLFLSYWNFIVNTAALEFLGRCMGRFMGRCFLSTFIVDTSFPSAIVGAPFLNAIVDPLFLSVPPTLPLREFLRDPSATGTGLALLGGSVWLLGSEAVHGMNYGKMLYRFSYWIP